MKWQTGGNAEPFSTDALRDMGTHDIEYDHRLILDAADEIDRHRADDSTWGPEPEAPVWSAGLPIYLPEDGWTQYRWRDVPRLSMWAVRKVGDRLSFCADTFGPAHPNDVVEAKLFAPAEPNETEQPEPLTKSQLDQIVRELDRRYQRRIARPVVQGWGT